MERISIRGVDERAVLKIGILFNLGTIFNVHLGRVVGGVSHRGAKLRVGDGLLYGVFTSRIGCFGLHVDGFDEAVPAFLAFPVQQEMFAAQQDLELSHVYDPLTPLEPLI